VSDPAAKAKILPFYLVVDVSYSMLDEDKIGQANRIMPDIQDALAENPVVADKVRFSVIDFSDDAQVILPLCDLSIQPALPKLEVRGGTSYVAAFTTLRHQIDRDVSQLKADGFEVHRPALFFVSDGEPTDDDQEWRRAFTELTAYDRITKTGFAFFPNVIPFGLGANPGTLRDIIHPQDRSKAYFMKDGAEPGPALRQMAEILIASTLLSGSSFGQGGPGFVLPDDDDIGDDVVVADYGDLL
jgi:uncharacterized protein YegL